MTFNKRFNKSIAIALVGVTIITPMLNIVNANSNYEYSNRLENVSYEMEQNLSNKARQQNLTLEEYNNLLASGEIKLQDSIYYNNNNYYSDVSSMQNERTVGALIRLGTKLLSLPWAKNVIAMFMKVLRSQFYMGVATTLTAEAVKYVCVNGLPKVDTSDIVGYGHYTRGYRVTTLQKYLAQHGYDIKADGIFGEKTEKALKSFQRSRSLDADGLAGRKTWYKLVDTRKYI